MLLLHWLLALCLAALLGEASPAIEPGNSSQVEHHPIPHHLSRRDNQPKVPKNTDALKNGYFWQWRDAPWGLGRISKSRVSHFRYPSSAGVGTYIYVLDTGVDDMHEELKGRVEFGFDATAMFLPYLAEIETQTWEHGTHVASTAAGSKWGVAKRATIVNVKVLREPREPDYDTFSDQAIVSGLGWAIDDIVKRKRIGKAVINMSLNAMDWGLDSWSCARGNSEVNKAIDLGIPVVVAAGNHNLPVHNACPARVPRAITVGASNQKNERVRVPDSKDGPGWGSNFGAKVDLYAPGYEVRGARGLTEDDEIVLSGTSMATPHVSGVVASLLAEEFFTPEQMKKKLWELSEKANRKNILENVEWFQSYLLYNGRPE